MFRTHRASALAEPKTHVRLKLLPEPIGYRNRLVVAGRPSPSGTWIAIAIKLMCNLLALVLAACLLSASAAHAQRFGPLVIERDFGGNIHEYSQWAQNLARRGVKIVIRGECHSACSLFLGNPGTCVEPDAVIKLHSATWTVSIPAAGMVLGDTAPGPTRQLLAAYPAKLRTWIRQRGGLTQNWLVLEKPELQAIFPPCQPSAHQQLAFAKH